MLQDLPEELLDLCWAHCSVPELRALRLCNKTLLRGASSRLFREVVLQPTKDSARKCLKIMEDDSIRRLVAQVTFKHDTPQEDSNGLKEDSDGAEAGSDAYLSDEDDDEVLPNLYKQCCRRLPRFPNLQSVKFCFSGNCVAPEEEGDYGFGKEVAPFEELESKDTVLRLVLEGLHHSPVNMKSLEIVNLQNMVVQTTVELASFKKLVGALTTLALQIATEYDDAAPETSIERPELHTFFGQDLTRVWLQPLQAQLTSLTLYADTYWGYFPSCPLEELHFPYLKSLALGNYTFAHDTQLEWILKHGETLQSLSLDDCPILHHCTMHCGFPPNRLPPTLKSFKEDYESESSWQYEARWHDYLPRMQSGLPKLRELKMGHGGWDNNEGAMTSRHTLGCELVAGRYIAFHGGTGPSQWIEPRERWKVQEDGKSALEWEYDGCWDDEQRPKFPGCEHQDLKALEELMKVVRSRG